MSKAVLFFLFFSHGAFANNAPCPSFLEKVYQSRWKSPDARSAREFGGFAYGIDAKEIQDIADIFSPPGAPITPILGKRIETVLINAHYRKGFWDKVAVISRDITGGHLFNDGNHRIAFEVVKRLMSRNGIVTKVSDETLYNTISKIGRNAEGFQTAEEIAAALRGY